MFYLLIYLPCYVICFLHINNFLNRSKDKEFIYYYFLIFILILAILTGIRGSSDEYTRLFYYSPNFLEIFNYQSLLFYFEKSAFALLSTIIKFIGLNSQFLLILSSFIFFYILFNYVTKFSNYYLLFFCIYSSHLMLHHSWTGLRMSLASIMILPMIYYLLQKKYFKSYMFLIFSILFHYISILSLLIFFFNKKFNNFLFLFIFSLAFFFYLFDIYKILLSSSFVNFLPYIVKNYIENEQYGYEVSILNIKTLQQSFVLGLLIIFREKITKQIKYKEFFNIILNIYFFSTISIFIFNNNMMIFTRTYGHFNIIEPFLIIYLVYISNFKKIFLNILISISIVISILNYLILERLPQYDFFINFQQDELIYSIYYRDSKINDTLLNLIGSDSDKTLNTVLPY